MPLLERSRPAYEYRRAGAGAPEPVSDGKPGLQSPGTVFSFRESLS